MYLVVEKKNPLNQFEIVHLSLSLLSTKFTLPLPLSLSFSCCSSCSSSSICSNTYHFPIHRQWYNASPLPFSTRRSHARLPYTPTRHHTQSHNHTHTHTHTIHFSHPFSSFFYFTHATTYSTAQCTYLTWSFIHHMYNKANRASQLEKWKRLAPTAGPPN